MRHPYFDVPRPTILGHRGAAGESPENTMVSFRLGLEQGADIIESDVHVTRDGVPVLIHDGAVDRTTEGRGRVADLDWDEVHELDAGYRFTPDEGASFPFRGQGLRIPSLEEAFNELPGTRLNLELKEGAPGLVEQSVATLRRCGRSETTLLTAGEDEIMAALREELARTGARPALGAALADILAFIKSAQDGRAPPTDSMALQIPAVFAGRPLVTPELVAHARTHDIAVHVWTVNDTAEARELLDRGVDGLVTDFPGRMRELVGPRGAD